MATKKPDTPAEPTTAVAVSAPKSTAVAMPGNWRDRIAAVAVKVAEAEKPSGGFISFKSGRLSIGEDVIAGDKIDVVIVHSLFHNKYYDTPYNAAKPTPPACYAFGMDEEEMAFSDKAERPQGGEGGYCSTCPMNEWGSDPKGGRGKACTNSRRVWLLPADVSQSVDKATRTDFIQCDLPVTSVKNFSRLVREFAEAGNAPFQFVVQLSVKPDDKTLFQVNWRAMEQIRDEAVLEALARRNYAKEQEDYPEYPTTEEMAERQAGGSNKF